MENRYDKYKDSGIEWIGEIPEHWEVIPHKRIMRKKKIIKELYAGENILSLTKKGVIIRDLEAGGKMPTTFNGYQILYPDNLLMCLFDIDVTPRCVGIIKDKGLSSPAYSQFVLNQLGYTPFFDYLLRYMDDEKCLLHLSKNLRNSLTEDDFGQIETIVPPTQEQQSIATYLDQKCGEIDELIALQEEMITKLQSYKQSVITEAVTKGLDKNAPLKDSGIEWIGEIPEHWEITKIQYLTQLKSGYNLTTEEIKDSGLYPVYGGNGIRGYYDKYFLEGDYVLIGRQGALCGNINYSTGKSWATEHAVVCYPKTKYITKWFGELLRVMNLNQYSLAAAQPGLAVERIKLLPIPIIPVSEQQAIADYLDQKCGEIDELISIKQQKIEKLKDYKKSLIFECVTGKRKVC